MDTQVTNNDLSVLSTSSSCTKSRIHVRARIAFVLAITVLGLILFPMGAYASDYVNGTAASTYDALLIGILGSFILGLIMVEVIFPFLPPLHIILSHVSTKISPSSSTPTPTRRTLPTATQRNSRRTRGAFVRLIRTTLDNLHDEGHMSAATFLLVIPLFIFYAAAGGTGYMVLLLWRVRNVARGMRAEFFVESFKTWAVYWVLCGYIGYGIVVFITAVLMSIRFLYRQLKRMIRRSNLGKGENLDASKKKS